MCRRFGNDQRIQASRDDHRAGGLCRDPERHSERLGLRAQPAGIWTEFKGDLGIKAKPLPRPKLVYGFLKAMPMILTTDEEQMPGRGRRGMRRRRSDR
jgi:hypothetical protein